MKIFRFYLFSLCLAFVASSCSKDNIDVIEDAKQNLQEFVPVVYINTPEGREITSKETYIDGSEISIIENGSDILHSQISIRGRGNSTWNQDKKPYKFKFEKKESVFSLPEDKTWVLLANYFDPTHLRNDIAFYLGSLSTLDFTPESRFVWLILNDQDKGIYQLSENVKVSKNRVNIGDDGFLLELDGLAKYEEDAVYFYLKYFDNPISIKNPDLQAGDEKYNLIKSYLLRAEAALFSESFKDKQLGWRNYFDVDSFVDYYIISELIKNSDTFRWSSTFMTYQVGGKIKMGPLWDYDRGFGNYFQGTYDNRGFEENDPNGFFIKNTPWYSRLFEDPSFVDAVKKRYDFYYTKKQELLKRIDYQSSLLDDFIVAENQLWGMVRSEYSSIDDVIQSYYDALNNMKNWISIRMDWLNTHINAL